jgi:hypothetical protein
METRPAAGKTTETWVLRALRADLEEWEAAGVGDPISAYHRGALGRYLTGLRTLAGAYDRPRAVLLVALALGPRTDGLPGAWDLASLQEAAALSSADVVDLGVAWGCGWRRAVAPDHDWHGRWAGAVLALSTMAEGSIKQTLRWLADAVPGVAEALRALGPRERRERVISHANQIAMELALGVCTCGHGGPRAASDGSCGRGDHRLGEWRPDVCRLPAFVATAVRGSARLPLRSGAFATSMLADVLREDPLVRVEAVEFHVCRACNPELVSGAVRGGDVVLSGIGGSLHDVGRCPVCRTPADRDRDYHVVRKHWLVVPADWGGSYQPVRRHRCARCRNLFPEHDERCPLCGLVVGPGRRLTSVWVRGASEPTSGW